MGKLIVMLSQQGGVGKSTISVGVCCALGEMGKRVLLVETDISRPLGILLEVGERAVYHLGDVVNGSCDFSDAVVPVFEGFDFLAGPGVDFTREQYPLVAEIFDNITELYDFVVIDKPSTQHLEFEKHLAEFTAVITVLNEPVSIRSAQSLAIDLKSLGNNSRQMIVNNFAYSLVKKGYSFNLDEIIDKTSIKLLGVVPFEQSVYHGRIRGEVARDGRAAKAHDRIAKRLAGYGCPLPPLKKL